MITRTIYKNFPPEYLGDHQDILLYDLFHHLQAYLLCPPHCVCDGLCSCDEMRQKIVLSLNMDLYDGAVERNEASDKLHAMRFLFDIPETIFCRLHYTKGYPSWLIHKELQKQEKENLLKSIEHLIWTLLRLAKTYETSVLNTPWASLNGAIQLILGDTPLKTKNGPKKPYFCGEKAYGKRLREYKPICHFIAAMEMVKKDSPIDTATQIKRFLSISQWLKEKLLAVQTTNVKNEHLFLQENFFSLPVWLQLDNVDIPLEPFKDKLKEINNMIESEFAKQDEAWGD